MPREDHAVGMMTLTSSLKTFCETRAGDQRPRRDWNRTTRSDVSELRQASESRAKNSGRSSNSTCCKKTKDFEESAHLPNRRWAAIEEESERQDADGDFLPRSGLLAGPNHLDSRHLTRDSASYQEFSRGRHDDILINDTADWVCGELISSAGAAKVSTHWNTFSATVF